MRRKEEKKWVSLWYFYSCRKGCGWAIGTVAREVTVVDTQQGKLWEDLQRWRLKFTF